MPAQPKIETLEQACAYLREERERYEQFEIKVQPLWTSGRRFVVGVVTRTHKQVYTVGPRGGLDLWISADDVTARMLARFFSASRNA